MSNVADADAIPEIVYAAVITTIVAFAVTLPGARGRLARGSVSAEGAPGAMLAGAPTAD